MMNQNNNPFEMICLNCIKDPADSTCRHCHSYCKTAKLKADILFRERHNIIKQQYATYVNDVGYIPASTSIDEMETRLTSIKNQTPNLY